MSGGQDPNKEPYRPVRKLDALKEAFPVEYQRELVLGADTETSAGMRQFSILYGLNHLNIEASVRVAFPEGRPTFWPTPHGFSPDGKSNGPSGNELGRAVNRAFPTPRATDGSHGGRVTPRKGREGGNLVEAVSARMFATPKSCDWKGQSQREIHAPGDALPNTDRGDGQAIGGSLNPDWVEWLMGWPIGWTACEPLAMDRFRQWQRSHGVS